MKPDYRADFEAVCNLADYGDAEQNCGLPEPAIERIRVLGPKLLAMWEAVQAEFVYTDGDHGYLHDSESLGRAYRNLEEVPDES